MTEPRKRGRPPSDEKSTVLYVRVPSRIYDAAYKQAQRDRMSMPDMVRRAMDKAVKEDYGEE